MVDELDILQNDAGNPIFVDVAEAYRRDGKLREAIEICLKGLSSNPSCHLGRLVLARVFYERGELPFAAREVKELCAVLPELDSLRRLLKSLAPDAQQGSGEVFRKAQSIENGPSSDEQPAVPQNQGIRTNIDREATAETVAEAEFDLDEIDILEEDLKK